MPEPRAGVIGMKPEFGPELSRSAPPGLFFCMSPGGFGAGDSEFFDIAAEEEAEVQKRLEDLGYVE
jgi:hypothetical protein